jgi:hypothetical protein
MMASIAGWDPTVSVEEEGFAQSSKVSPNPFNQTAVIEFELEKASQVLIKIYDSFGNEVRALLDSYINAGPHKVAFISQELPSAVYYYKINIGEKIISGKILLAK